MDVKMVRAFNSTSNYLVISNVMITGSMAYYMPIIVHVHFDPDPTACATFGYKTPPTASYLKTPYLFTSHGHMILM